MKSNISSKLVIILTVTLVAAFVLQSIILTQREVSSGRNNIIKNADTFSSLSVAEVVNNYNIYYDSGFYKYAETVNKLFEKNADLSRIKIVNQNGAVLFDSEEIAKGKYESANGVLRTVEAADLGAIRGLEQTSKNVRISNLDYYEVIAPYIEEWGAHNYTVVYYFTFISLEISIRQIIFNSIILTASFCGVIVVLIYLLSLFIIVRPLKKIAKAAASFVMGNYDSQVNISTKDEIGDLAGNLNEMFRALKKSKLELESYTKNLEAKIKERTRELEIRSEKQLRANEKLEHVNRLMVGRELRMIELKKEIEKLKKASGGNQAA